MKKLDKKDGKIWDAQGKDLGRVKNFPFKIGRAHV